ncbi:16S rRNA (guanine(966)-N(2))-methyltransferase [hydrothermal vent metagenome]|uniref:16S rRNA (Guanine(966)-N(2))-methyltransferase n=1 Tax=hydrothermal vent metagenome TaxID=652676 RepID=A0A3B0TSI6_9ZZZZ
MRIIAGRFRGKKIHSPDDDTIRPTSDRVREALFSILASRLPAGFADIKVLDLFAGTGALGLEALSRGAQLAAFVDIGVQARGIIRSNIELFGVGGQSKLLKRDAIDLGTAQKFLPFNLVFIDPPYGQGLAEKALISANRGNWIAPGALIVIEESRKWELGISQDDDPRDDDPRDEYPRDDNLQDFELVDRRDYGQSSISILTKKALTAPE